MSHTILSNNLPPEALREQFEAEGIPPADFERMNKELYEMLSGSFTDLIKRNSNFFVRGAIDQYGNTYEEVTFRVDARYTRDGDLWVAGGGFATNVTSLLRELHEALIT